MTKKSHLHKYKRKDLGKGYMVYMCTEPSCTHYIRVDLAEGKLCKCNRCGEPMIMSKKAMQLAKPHCDDCTKPRVDRADINALNEILGNI